MGMPLNDEAGTEHARADAAAELIWNAWTSGERLDALPDGVRPEDLDDGWAVQERLGTHAGPGYGWKLAATSAAGQAHIGIGGPLPGRLFERFRHEPGAVLDAGALHMKVVEAEFAFRMARDVPSGASREEVLDAVGALHLAIEVPDSRFADFGHIGSAQLLADSACAGLFVLGPEIPDWRDLELSTWGTTLWINGEAVEKGTGGNVLGDPRTALAWLADDLPRFGSLLRAGEIVTTGTTTTPPRIGPGDEVRADFGDLGEVLVSFRR